MSAVTCLIFYMVTQLARQTRRQIVSATADALAIGARRSRGENRIMSDQPFRVAFSPALADDLRQRLRAVRWSDA